MRLSVNRCQADRRKPSCFGDESLGDDEGDEDGDGFVLAEDDGLEVSDEDDLGDGDAVDELDELEEDEEEEEEEEEELVEV